MRVINDKAVLYVICCFIDANICYLYFIDAIMNLSLNKRIAIEVQLMSDSFFKIEAQQII